MDTARNSNVNVTKTIVLISRFQNFLLFKNLGIPIGFKRLCYNIQLTKLHSKIDYECYVLDYLRYITVKTHLILLFIFLGLRLKAQFQADSIHKVPVNPACLELKNEYTFTDSSNLNSISFKLLNDSIDFEVNFRANDSLINQKGTAPKTFIGLEFVENELGESMVYITDYEYTLADDLIFSIQMPNCNEAYISKKDNSIPIYLYLK